MIIHIPLDLIVSTAKELISLSEGVDHRTAAALWESMDNKEHKSWKDRAYQFLTCRNA